MIGGKPIVDFLYTQQFFKRSIAVVFLLVLLIASCSKPKKKDPNETILQIKELGQLVTVQYTLSKIVKASDDKTWYKLGDRKIVMSCEAHIKAGVDLQQLSPQQVTIQDTVISLQLPHAKLFSLSIPPDRIQVRYAEVGALRDSFSETEKQQLLRQAERQIQQLADSLGIVKTAEDNAVVFLQTLLQQSGFKKVQISFYP